jgi:UDP-N-acetylglucosamine 1-carboxyvinyltransferase
MDKIRIRGGKSLRGEVKVSGAKNAALPILFSSLLSSETSRYRRVPGLQDIEHTELILKGMGVEVEKNDREMKITPGNLKSHEAPYDLVRKMRASILVLGPLLARFGYAKVSLPGGCAIGARPIDLHLKAMEKLGAEIELQEGYVVARAKKLRGAKVVFDFPSVGATENLMMAAALAEGETRLDNCAKEPEIVDLARALRSMGAKISGEGSKEILIEGVSSLKGADHEVIGDRIEAGTYLMAAIATQGSVKVNGINPDFLYAVIEKCREVGARIEISGDSISLSMSGRSKSVDITTLPHPGFPTDMQAQFMAAMCVAEGSSLITETIFENRFMHVPELMRLGADLSVRSNSVLVRGKEKLLGAPVMATDLRASASLVIAGLCAEGVTTVSRIYHLDRGYEKMEMKLSQLGADIERVSE